MNPSERRKVNRLAGGYLALLLALLLAACANEPVAQVLPTARIALATTRPSVVPPTPGARATAAPAIVPSAIPETIPASNLAAPLDQYRAWMEAARLEHPYGEPLDHMWSVMLCESSGDATIVAGSHYGLFQYSQSTWIGDWNPYRDSSILDPRTQIFATASAWQQGYQSWWGCY